MGTTLIPTRTEQQMDEIQIVCSWCLALYDWPATDKNVKKLQATGRIECPHCKLTNRCRVSLACSHGGCGDGPILIGIETYHDDASVA